MSLSSNKFREIIFPRENNIQALQLAGLNAPTSIENISSLTKLTYLTLSGHARIDDFSFLRNFNDQVYLYPTPRKLFSLDCLSEKSNLIILDVGTDIIISPDAVDKLTQLKCLKYLSIKAKKNELGTLREALPDCIVNYHTLLGKAKGNG